MEPQSDSQKAPSLEQRLDLSATTGWTRKRRLILIGSLLVCLGLLLPFLPAEDDTLAYLTVAAARGDLRVTVTATGELQPVNQVDVGTEVSGTIAMVAVDFNDAVGRGQVLARLDTEELEAQVLQARANLKVAQARIMQTRATLEEARLKHERCLALARKSMCSQDELDTLYATLQRATADLASAEAQVEVGRATLDAYRTRLEKAEIRAPIDGLVLARRIEPGQTVAASLQTPVLFVIAEDLRDMELHVDVDEADIGQVAVGQHATFTVDAYVDRLFPAQITQVRLAPDTESGVVTYETLLRVDNRELLLRPGMTATAEIVVADVADALLVPNAALSFQPSDGAAQVRSERSFFQRLIPGPPRRERSRPEPEASGPGRRVWVLRNGVPSAVAVEAGLTDGVRTVVAGELGVGDPVITGVDLPGNDG